jgi:histidinol-phosphatase (PHP family)
MIDYHIHTILCNHAHGSMEDYVREALSRGIDEICFLDHLILDGPGMKHSMDIREVPLYVQSVSRLKWAYRGSITIRLGLEVDFIPEKRGDIDRIIERYAFDVIGGSFHFVNGRNVASRKEAPKVGPAEERMLVDGYFEGLMKMLESPYFDFICHPDIVKKTGIAIPEQSVPLIEKVLDRVAEKGVALEFNTGGWDHPVNDSYPSADFVRKCFSRGIPFTIGSDAHQPQRVGMHYERAVDILSSAGYTSVRTYDGRQVRPVPLKV